jgi:Flp pilus assembly protein TadG
MYLKSRRGSVFVEFALAGIPIMLLIISVMEISRGMWMYTTLSYAVTEASRYAIVHGSDCAVTPNVCTIRVSNVAQIISNSSPQLDPDQMNVTMSSVSPSGGINQAISDSLTNCLYSTGTGPFPTWNGSSSSSGWSVSINATYPFQSPLTMFFPGLTSRTAPITVTLQATSQEPILF